MRAVEDGCFDLVRMLIEKGGADYTILDSDRMSLLNIAGDSSKSPAIFQYLLARGLDPYLPDNFGYFPLHDACLDSNFTTYIVNSGLDFYRGCAQDVFKGLLSMALETRDALRLLVRRIPAELLPALVNVWPPRYVSPLCNAARRGDLRSVEILLAHGADLEFEGCDAGTALMAACMAGHVHIVKYLVRAGAKVCYQRGGVGDSGAGDDDGKKEAVVFRSALVAARKFSAITDWLLVRRWTDQNCLTQSADVSQEQDVADDAVARIGPWAGVITVELELSGVGSRYGIAWRESMVDYLQRKDALRRSLLGEIVYPSRWH
ncbi:ankyrin repeat-containing domain protein [Xylariales sp. PMI_506]|nr:ankyrin repeat-containing domain protein [Xylariales sp. PMI_506]